MNWSRRRTYPWKDPETLDLALFGLFAPLGLVTAFVAAVRGASKWVVLPLLVALSILTLVGFMEALSV
jgi:fatty acid desaturase